MPKASPLQESFNGGEFSPLVYGRLGSDRYKTGLAVCKNYLPTLQGPITRRPGTYYVSAVKDSTKKTRIMRFEFSTTQAYIIEFGNLYCRFYRNNGQILETALNITAVTGANPGVVTSNAHGYSNGDEVYITGVLGMTQLNGRNFKVANVTANTFELNTLDGATVDTSGYTAYASAGTCARVYTVVTTYAEADLFSLNVTQSADTLYIVANGYAPRKLTRSGHTSWTLTTIALIDGPYMAQNTTSTTMTLAGAGPYTMTASAITGINSGTGFAATDVGRNFRLKIGTVWTWVTITAWTSTTVVTVTFQGGAAAVTATATAVWRMGLYGGPNGYPSVVAFHEDRLGLGGCTQFPQRIDLSNTGDYENYGPSDQAGVIVDSNALAFTLNSSDVNVLRWMISHEKGLLVGTVGGEWSVTPSVQIEALSPTNINAKQVTFYGSANVAPIVLGKSVLFASRSAKKLREMSYYFEVDGFQSPDRTLLSEHITGSTGIKQMAYQKEPQPIVWAVRNDGVLASMVYNREEGTLVTGWSRHIVGGVSDAASTAAVVESVAVIPSADGTRDDVWLVVKRYINGATKRTIEYVTRFFDDSVAQKDAFFVDCGLTYDAPVTISGATKANPVVVTANAHGFANGDSVLISDVAGMTQLNGNTYVVANKTANTFELKNAAGTANIDGTAYSTYVSGGSVRKYVTTITGLWHLEGQSVTILGDGAVQPDQTVANGTITLSIRATTVQIGLGYNSDGQMLRVEAGAADGTALGKTRRTHKVALLVYRSLGLKLGMSFTKLTPIIFRKTSDALSRAVPLFSGLKVELPDADYDLDNQLCWRQDLPLPSTILAVSPQLHTQDAA
jgi:hypothetical protein